jgi:general secretion pathway protein C
MRRSLAIAVLVSIVSPVFAAEMGTPPEGCVPNFENGQPAGYKCQKDQPAGNFQKLGLKNGDVIKGVDGQAVNDPAQALQKLNNKPKKVQVVRNGQDETLTLDNESN